jgi:hypothetical protein
VITRDVVLSKQKPITMYEKTGWTNVGN